VFSIRIEIFCDGRYARIPAQPLKIGFGNNHPLAVTMPSP
jgi:hypothetical protein